MIREGETILLNPREFQWVFATMNVPLISQVSSSAAMTGPSRRTFWLAVSIAAPMGALATLVLVLLLQKPVEVEELPSVEAVRGRTVVAGGRNGPIEVPTPAPASIAPPPPVHRKGLSSPYDDIVEPAAAKHGVPADLVRAVIRVESNNNPRAVSRVGARGLMQLMPATAKQLDVKNAFDAEQNINGGAKYLKQLSERFDGDLVKTVAAYNAGPAAVMKYGGKVPPYEETQKYVKRVMGYYSNAISATGPLAVPTPLLQVTDDPSSILVWPAPGLIVRKLSMRGEDRETGVELRVPSASAIRAASEGRVVAVLKERDGKKSVTVKHDERYSTTYAHLSVVLVDVNDVVAAGDVIGNAPAQAGNGASVIRFDLRESDVPRDPIDFRWRGVNRE
jgi:murein DD-endopeptidase MepM/ murein hydrolase activator NlpD